MIKNDLLIKKICQEKLVFIAGERKNAGKTTFLNYILGQVRNKNSLAYLTIGIDGESKDQIFGTPKPKIYCYKGDIVVTTDLSMKNSFCEFEILECFPFNTQMGRIIAVKILRGGYIELVGAEKNTDLAFILKYLTNYGIKHIFVDGAVNRITQITAFPESSFFYVSKITPKNFSSTLDRIKIIFDLFSLPLYKNKNENDFYLEGAVTSIKLTKTPKETQNLIFEDLSKVFIKYNEFINLSKKYKLYVKKKYNLLGFLINLLDIEIDEFEKMISNNELLDLIYYNPHNNN